MENQSSSLKELIKTNLLSLLPVNLFLFLLRIWPVLEKSHSNGTDVAIIDNFYLAISNKFGCIDFITSQASSGFVFIDTTGLVK